MALISKINTNDITNKSNARDHKASFHGVPDTVFPISIVKILVSVEVGLNNPLANLIELPITI